VAQRRDASTVVGEEPLWYKDAVIYELHVRAFFDANGDGIGDFQGLTQKLDYLQDLGVTTLWLLPFYPSPLRDDGYDIADYMDVHPSYGTLGDFKEFLREAHKRGLRVITELVLNHTSDQHPWFQRARQPDAPQRYKDFYVWNNTPNKYNEARIIFKDFEPSNWSYDPVAKSYYWHRFYAHQPDLNFDNPTVHRALARVLDFWLEMGVDGLRLDAVPYLYEREGTNCENLPETHAYLKVLRAHMDRNFKDKMLLAEANQWPDDAVAYFGTGDEAHMAFHFPVMPRIFMATRMESRFPIIDIMQQTPEIPANCQWALFLRNHDELTLEMVTDEERDYMYRVYAQDTKARVNLGIRRRLAPLLENDRRKIELLTGILFTMPGTPVMYYGDEIGMGDNFHLGDRNGVRTPMQWSGDRNSGFSRANPQRLYLPCIIDPEYHYEAINVEAQQNNPSSLLWWMKRLISLRKRHRVFGRGALEFLYPENSKVLAYVRSYENEKVLVVCNLSRFMQTVELDLSKFEGTTPVEMFGRTRFPRVAQNPYFLTLGPFAFHWFTLESDPVDTGQSTPPALIIRGAEVDLAARELRPDLENAIQGYVRKKRWFGGKARTVYGAEVLDIIPIVSNGERPYDANFLVVRLDYTEGESETYVLPIALASGTESGHIRTEHEQSVIAFLRRDQEWPEEWQSVLYEPVMDREFCGILFDAMARRRSFRGQRGRITATSNRMFRILNRTHAEPYEPAVLRTEQSNTSIVYGDKYILKLFRRLEDGVNPDMEIGLHLTEKCNFPYTPAVVGFMEYRQDSRVATLGVLQAYIPNQGTAWERTLTALDVYYESALARTATLAAVAPPRLPLAQVAGTSISREAVEAIGPYLETARLLGQRTAELHLALAQDKTTPGFAPELFTIMYQRSLYHGFIGRLRQPMQTLRQKVRDLPAEVRPLAQQVIDREGDMRKRFSTLRNQRINAIRIRTHGDFHLGQVLDTGRDLVIIDFEGEPARPLGERLIKHSPLRDVAGMIRSFHYAAYAALSSHGPGGAAVRPEDIPTLEPWARVWHTWVSAAFLNAYLKTQDISPVTPVNKADLQTLLDAYLLEKAVYELGYELNNRPDWVRIPLQGILDLLSPTD